MRRSQELHITLKRETLCTSSSANKKKMMNKFFCHCLLVVLLVNVTMPTLLIADLEPGNNQTLAFEIDIFIIIKNFKFIITYKFLTLRFKYADTQM